MHGKRVFWGSVILGAALVSCAIGFAYWLECIVKQ